MVVTLSAIFRNVFQFKVARTSMTNCNAPPCRVIVLFFLASQKAAAWPSRRLSLAAT